mmetsp:Transcript_25369/g.41215  ORF Transcript_25369/g.41215 Transcript_25369/m.41215 type:complete len:141 (+) Transcript_25369:723-1145(+)
MGDTVGSAVVLREGTAVASDIVEGFAVGTGEGPDVVFIMGDTVGSVVRIFDEETAVCSTSGGETVGSDVGIKDGALVSRTIGLRGSEIEGSTVSKGKGKVGTSVGTAVGSSVGETVGSAVGTFVGTAMGTVVGIPEGVCV